jgi:cytoskeletal protein CcmA (bactofilin family)
MSKADKSEAQMKQTTVEEGTEFKGTLHSTCQVMVRGVVDGDLTAPTVIVSETGTVVGNVKAQSIQSAGVLAGRVDADDVYLSGSVRSDTVIRAKTLEVKLHSSNKVEITFGECILDVGEDPAAETADSDKDKASSAASKAAPTATRRSVPPPAEANKNESTDEGSSNHHSVPPAPM